MRHLVDLMLSTPQIKDYIEKSYRVSTVERHRKRRDDPVENPIVLPPLGEDSKRQRLWVIEDKPRVYISGNPWKKSTTMTAITNTIEDVEALAKSYAMSSYQTERKAAEIVQQDKMMWKQLINQSKKEKDLSELLAGQWDGSFIRRCEREEARVAKIRKRNKEREEAEMHLAKQIEEQKAMGGRKRKSTKNPGFVTDIKDEDIDGEDEDDDADTEEEVEEDELEDVSVCDAILKSFLTPNRAIKTLTTSKKKKKTLRTLKADVQRDREINRKHHQSRERRQRNRRALLHV